METFGDQTTKTSEITSFPWLCSWRSVLSLPFPTSSIWAVPQLASRQQQWLSSISTLCNCTSACGQISPIPVLTTFSKVRSQQFREEGTLGTHSVNHHLALMPHVIAFSACPPESLWRNNHAEGKEVLMAIWSVNGSSSQWHWLAPGTPAPHSVLCYLPWMEGASTLPLTRLC